MGDPRGQCNANSRPRWQLPKVRYTPIASDGSTLKGIGQRAIVTTFGISDPGHAKLCLVEMPKRSR